MASTEFSYGLEHEWADVDRSVQIPSEIGSWNLYEDTIVNSDGSCNDQLGDRGGRGGEINTVPTDTIDGQIDITKKLLEIFDKAGTAPSTNYKCGMHVHVSYAGISSDLEKMKLIMMYVAKHQDPLLWSIFRPRRPRAIEYVSKDDYEFALEYFRKYKLKYVAHTYSKDQIDLAMSSENVEQFFEAVRPVEDEYFDTDRQYINLSSIEKNGTLEFRQFPATTRIEEVRSCLEWAKRFVDEALGNQRDPEAFMEGYDWEFPEGKFIDAGLERLYRIDYAKNAKGEWADRVRGMEKQWR